MIHCLNKRYENHNIAALLILLFFMTVVTGIFHQINSGELLVFFCFQALCIVLPGAAVMTLMPVKNLRGIEQVMLIYASGYMLTMLLYVTLMLTVESKYMRVSFLALPVFSIVVLWLKNSHKKQSVQEIMAEEGSAIWILTVLTLFFVSLVVFSMRWKIPYTAGANNYETDFLYWAGDIVALKKHFPPKEFRTLASGYRYHYFGALQQAAVSAATGIQAVKVAVCYSYIEGAVLLGLSSFALVSRVIKNRTAQVLTLLLMLFSTGYEEKALVTYIWHMHQVPMSYHIAQSLGMIVVVLLLAQLENKRMDIVNLVWSMCCLVCCMGTKSSAGAVVFCGVVMVYVYLILSQSSRRTACIAVGAFLLVFGAAGIYLWPIARNYNLTLYLPDIQFGNGRQMIQSIRACMVWIGEYFAGTAVTNFWIFIPAEVYSLFLIIRKKIKKEQTLFLLLMLIGTMGNYAIAFNGNSQMYFSFIAFPFAALLTGSLAETIFQRLIPPKVQCFMAGILSAAVVIFMLRNNYLGYFGYNFVEGLKNIRVPRPAEEGECLIGVSQAQCEAYTWIRDNTDEDVILLSDRVWGNVHDPTGIFSERYVYLYHDFETDYLRGISCFGGNREAVRYYAELGLDYIVQRKFYTPLFTCPEDVGEVVFENDEVAVYKLFWGQHGKNGVFY